MFSLSKQPILMQPTAPLHPHAGAVVTFEGRVRALNDAKQVRALEYEAYSALALGEGKAILAEAVRRFSLFDAEAVHRTGHLTIGELAVWVYASAMHRKEAFLATEMIIGEIKRRVPIWKKEYYESGIAQWVRCNHADHA